MILSTECLFKLSSKGMQVYFFSMLFTPVIYYISDIY